MRHRNRRETPPGVAATGPLLLTDAVYRALRPLVSGGRDGWERVAFLHGAAGESGARVTTIVSVPNTHRSPGGFGVALSAYRKAAASGSLVGLFHTHMRDSRPSAADLRLLTPGGLYQLIGAPAGRRGAIELRSFRGRPNGEVEYPPIEVIRS